MVELLVRFLAGGTLVVFVTLLARTRHALLSGLLVLFPIATLLGYFFIGREVDAEKLRAITLFSIYSLPATLVFLVSFYYVQSRHSVTASLAISTLAWLLMAGLLILLNNGVFRIGR
jgi:uncharacterized membrane protein (GlpM family)